MALAAQYKVPAKKPKAPPPISIVSPKPKGPVPGFATVTQAPNYTNLLAGYPGMVEATGAYGESTAAAADRRRNLVRQAIIKLGLAPGSLPAGALEGIDPNLAQTAAGNNISLLAMLDKQRGQQRGDLSAQLASRGILNSGALAGGEGRIQEDYSKNVAQATSDTLAQIQAALSDEASQSAQARAALGLARSNAATALSQDPRYQPTQRRETPWERALRLRSEALNRAYGLG